MLGAMYGYFSFIGKLKGWTARDGQSVVHV